VARTRAGARGYTRAGSAHSTRHSEEIQMLPSALRRAAPAALVLALACGDAGGEAPAGQVAAAPAAQPAAPAGQAAAATGPLVTVYKSASCGCCHNWVEHMRQNGFQVEAHDTEAMDQVRDQAGVPQAARSCHTARVGGYVVEGHVPADVVRRLLRERPADVAGLAVPGMVTGSPGMEGPYPEHYQVIAFTRDGGTRVYESR
jgi:hypothetical protein